MTGPDGNVYEDRNLFFIGHLLHYDNDHERGLFRVFDAGTGSPHLEWSRCRYSRTRRVQIDTIHEPSCDGFLPAAKRPLSYLGQKLMKCGCPVQVERGEFFWVVSPPGMQFTKSLPDGAVERVVHHAVCAPDTPVQ